MQRRAEAYWGGFGVRRKGVDDGVFGAGTLDIGWVGIGGHWGGHWWTSAWILVKIRVDIDGHAFGH